MTAIPHAALRAYERRAAAMLSDPECVGELLLVGLVMARAVDLNDPPLGAGTTLGHFAERVYGQHRYFASDLAIPGRHRVGASGGRARINDVVRADRRRYEPTDDWWVPCGRPMVRRDGLCGRAATDRRRLTDPATGERHYVGACSNRPCKAWYAGLLERNRQELAANTVPVPAANTGGVLERHLPEIDWWAIWRHLDPSWTPPPEDDGQRRPRFTVLVTDEVEPVEVSTRPALIALEGGWR